MSPKHVMIRLGVWPAIACSGAVIMVLSMFLDWYTQGERSRNSFELVRVPQVLKLDGFTPFTVAWFLVPLVGAAVVGFTVLGFRRLGAVLLLLQSLVLLPVGAAVLASDLNTGAGPAVAIVGGVLGLIGSIGLAALRPGSA